MAWSWRCDRPEAITMKSAMLDFPWRSMATMSSALSSSSDFSTMARSRRESSGDEVPWAWLRREIVVVLVVVAAFPTVNPANPEFVPTGKNDAGRGWPLPTADAEARPERPRRAAAADARPRFPILAADSLRIGERRGRPTLLNNRKAAR